jgi:CheY-like chemotaxis protein
LTTALLTRMGCDVDSAENGEDAVASASANTYDVIIMDIEMPVMDGLTAATQIRALDGPARRTPIIALSAFLADSQKASIWRESFDINLAKPAGREQLRKVIQAVIDVSHSSEVASLNCENSPSNAEGLIDRDALLRLRDEMTREAMQKLFQVVIGEIQDCAKMLDADSGANDPETVAKVAHKLKGIASTFAAPKLEKLATALEDEATVVSPPELLNRVTETCTCADETAAALDAARAA